MTDWSFFEVCLHFNERNKAFLSNKHTGFQHLYVTVMCSHHINAYSISVQVNWGLLKRSTFPHLASRTNIYKNVCKSSQYPGTTAVLWLKWWRHGKSKMAPNMADKLSLYGKKNPTISQKQWLVDGIYFCQKDGKRKGWNSSLEFQTGNLMLYQLSYVGGLQDCNYVMARSLI